MQGRLPKVAEEEYLLLTGWYRADDVRELEYTRLD
jgi:hypothetical protein